MLIRVMIADKDKRVIARIRYYLKDHKDIKIIVMCDNGNDLVYQYKKWKPDLIITEVDLPSMNGLEVMKQCYQLGDQIHFIFLAEDEKHALAALELDAIDFLVKPFRSFRLSKAIEKAKRVIASKRERYSFNNLPVKYNKGVYYIKKEEIYFIEKIGKKCVIYTDAEIVETRENMGELLPQLDDTFFLSHRSYIINLEKVTEISPYKETYIAYFDGVNRQAKISKLKINEVKERVSLFL
ncbi:LytR/AlgR family response regulator transcription factor [Niallia sp. FSL K6-0077]|uniref:LytR/AlgR family response regulator transcription factor n=1 Tax=Niallia sp. FSL K6-0077 TaxID=2954743 RepID=UPI0030FBE13C